MPVISTFPSLGQGGSGGMESFNGRTGSVIPQPGDYTAEMVGAATMDQVNAAIKEAILDSWDGEYPSEGGTTDPDNPDEKKVIENVPSQLNTLTYYGGSQRPTWSNYNSTQLIVGGDINGINAQVYTTTFTPKPGYVWSDGTTTAKSVQWSIGRASIELPVISGDFSYDGTRKSPTIIGYNSSKMTIGGDNAGTDAGTYTITFTPTNNYQWSDGSIDAANVEWEIKRAYVEQYPSQDGVLEYTGNIQSPVWKNYDSAKLIVGGDVSGVNVGSYTASFTPTSNYMWSDNTTDSVTVSWSIQKQTLEVPSFVGSFTYDGKQKSPEWTGYDSSKMTMTGETVGTVAGSYNVHFALGSNYRWTDGSSEQKTVVWNIAKAVISKVPSQNGSLTYNENVQSPAWSNFDTSKLDVEGTMSGVSAQEYTVTFTPKENYVWADGTSSSKSVKWKINRSVKAVPTTSDRFTYDGEQKTPEWTGYDSSIMTIGGTTTATNAGTYNVTFSLGENYQWSTGEVGKKSVSWSISRITIPYTPSQANMLVYTGSSQSPTWNNYDSAQLVIGGTTSSINAGTFNATFTPTSNYQWSDGSTSSKTVSWTIGRIAITTPSTSSTLAYTGSSQSPIWNNYDSSKITIGGTYSATNAGTYSATFTPKNNYKWNDNSISAKYVSWSISKIAGSLNISTKSVSLTASSRTGTITVTRAGNGVITATSSNTKIATTSLSGNVVTITAKATGNVTVTISVAAGTNHTAPSNQVVNVTVDLLPEKKSLNDTSWSDISAVSLANQGPNFWSVGDRKAVNLSGRANKLSLNTTLYVYIIGFNHDKSDANSSADGITFGTWKTALTGGDDVALTSGYSDDSDFMMYEANVDPEGWKNSYMRFTILGSTKTRNSDAATSTATSPKSNTLMSCLPSDLRNIMRPMCIYTDNGIGGVTATIDYLPLLAEFEVTGNIVKSNVRERDKQKQYAYYAAGNSKIKKPYNAASDVTGYWWLRSPSATQNQQHCGIGNNGVVYSEPPRYSHFVAPIFKV